jgi:type IV secretory pathway component VirB8
MMEAARTSETSVGNYFIRQYILEDNSELYTRRHENLKSHILQLLFFSIITWYNFKKCNSFKHYVVQYYIFVTES